jgi:hypothetical protein
MRFLGRLTAVYHRSPRQSIANLDESNWHLAMASEETAAERGVATLHEHVDGDPESNFPFFATITADGQKLPLILIARGKNVRCHKQFGNHDRHQFDVWHSPFGWSTEPLLLDSLDWLRQQMPPDPPWLLVDQFGTHTREAVINRAEALEIEVIWIARGATGRYQQTLFIL